LVWGSFESVGPILTPTWTHVECKHWPEQGGLDHLEREKGLAIIGSQEWWVIL
jgi:hypothetical protein